MTDTLPQATIAQVPLDGEPVTDKAFTSDGVTYRVRVLLVAEAAPVVATAGRAAAPFLQAYDITVTRLDEDGVVMADTSGRPVIVANTRWTIDEETFSRGLDAAALLDMFVRNLIWRAARVGTGPVALGEALASWGGGVRA